MGHYINRNPDHRCPTCGGAVLRIERLWTDRFIGMFKPVRRFRCEQFGCGWEGRLAISTKELSQISLSRNSTAEGQSTLSGKGVPTE